MPAGGCGSRQRPGSTGPRLDYECQGAGGCESLRRGLAKSGEKEGGTGERCPEWISGSALGGLARRGVMLIKMQSRAGGEGSGLGGILLSDAPGSTRECGVPRVGLQEEAGAAESGVDVPLFDVRG